MRGVPAQNMKIKFEKLVSGKGSPEVWEEVFQGATNAGLHLVRYSMF